VGGDFVISFIVPAFSVWRDDDEEKVLRNTFLLLQLLDEEEFQAKEASLSPFLFTRDKTRLATREEVVIVLR